MPITRKLGSVLALAATFGLLAPGHVQAEVATLRTASNTGPIGAGISYSALRPSGSLTVTTPGAVLDRMDFSGTVTISANNVVVKRSRVRTSGLYAVRVGEGVTGVVLEDLELQGNSTDSTKVSASVAPYGSWALRRANIWGFKDGVKVKDNQVVEDSYIHDLRVFPDSHNDGIQSVGGNNVIIRRNNIVGRWQGQTSALILQSDIKPLTNYTIEGNRLSGGTYTLYMRAKTGQPNPAGMIVRDNTWVVGSWKYGPRSIDGSGFTWTGNMYSDGRLYPR